MKRLVSLFLAFLLVLSAATAALAADAQPAANTQNISDALYSLGLFLGTGKKNGVPVYSLDGTLTRAHAIVLLVRMLGKEAEAEGAMPQHPFGDTASWYDAHVGYAYANGYTKGTGAKTYSGSTATNAKMFATFCLRALGYKDKTSADAAEGDFWWADAPAFAKTLGIRVSESAVFTRGDAVLTFWDALGAKLQDGKQTLAEKLTADGVFTASEYQYAQKIAAGTVKLFNTGTAGSNELPEILIPSEPTDTLAPTQPTTPTNPTTPTTPTNPTPTNPHELPIIDIA